MASRRVDRDRLGISSGGGFSEVLEPSARDIGGVARDAAVAVVGDEGVEGMNCIDAIHGDVRDVRSDRKSTRLNSSHQIISYAVFCLKKKKHSLSPLVPPNEKPHPLSPAH